ncbi:MAG: GDSL-type esterase/lipase family protein [bacterium]|nr:GDSL-type esterase/lipase family protein [bacterium]
MKVIFNEQHLSSFNIFLPTEGFFDMRGSAKVFAIVGLTFVCLLGLFYLPPISFGTTQLRTVDVLADIAAPADTVPAEEVATPAAPKGAWTDQWPDEVQPIVDYRTDSTGGMDIFYAALSEGKALHRPVRIAYLSDSFVEQDILLVDLRHFLQQRFGNGGLGMVRCRSYFDEQLYCASVSNQGLTAHHIMKRKEMKMDYFLLPQGYAQVSGNASATITALSGEYATSWKTATVWGCAESSTNITCRPATNTVCWSPSSGLQKAEFSAQPMNSIKLQFSGNAKIFGVALENEHGIVVDNFGVRGSSGLQLAYLASNLSADFAAKRPYDLIVVHYGLNALSPKSTTKQCETYIKNLKKSVQHIQKIYPHSAVLLVSASDMAARGASGKMQSMPMVQNLVKMQNRLAADLGVAFFNFYEMMGGAGSIVKMVENKQAEKDYTHIKKAGGETLARRFAQSFEAGFNNYQRKKKAGY